MAAQERPKTIREWLFHFVVYGLAVVGLNALSFIVIPIYTRRISPSEYGVLELLNRAQDVLAIAVMSGFGLAALAFYQFEGKNPERQKRVFSTALLGILANGALLLIVALPFAREISQALFGTEQYTWAVYMVLPLIPLEMVFSLGLVSLQARYRSVAYITMGVGRFAIGLTLNLVMVLWLKMGLKGILIATALHTSIPAIVTFVLIMQRSGWGWEWKLWKELLRYGLPFIPGGLFLFVLNSGDRYLINLFHGKGAVGLYAISYKIGSITTFALMSPFLKVWGPAMIDVANGENGARNISRLMTHVVTAYLYLGLVISLLTPAVLSRLVSAQYQGAQAAVPVITLAYLFWAMSIIGDTPFYATKHTDVKPFILGGSALLCISAYLILIPAYGILGAAWATVIAFAFFAMLTMRVSQRYMKVPYEYGLMLLLGGFTIALFVSGQSLMGRGVPSAAVGALAAILFPAALWFSPLWNEGEKRVLLKPALKLQHWMKA